MTTHTVSLRALKLALRWLTEGATPHQIPVALSWPWPGKSHGSVILLDNPRRT